MNKFFFGNSVIIDDDDRNRELSKKHLNVQTNIFIAFLSINFEYFKIPCTSGSKFRYEEHVVIKNGALNYTKR